ncbi:hypothetical protein APHWI1_0052 [Anaplasma phagocytophilum str. ApWI1]|uniref:Uncharacterized protein n=2 Tax=Anaplasma phagocytophilum TaxID=948 RepID=A0A0F3NB25_ANAPH|nr:hypothetical protein APHWEB_1459 [Anaplasma phagocytophilum str. Webster]KJV65288.1 hypothetical protein EPHNCH_0864 [Anaplasma phagocytophilum str. NCH-1]KJV82191.1 hypothetical protein APHHGE2_0852 [Anaplasma phagocytophilum str. HGE2]KJV84316.1 hypothetical protein APHWI1_0052 [Anaplasma phagocytophilum str. ApWI1]KJV87767.1 hypothetical protein APHNYW_0583 [Anaplasma phagocytophilum str. ApNYW]KJV98943.1 hypothetical protein OTSANNIE_0820 [Anaplasma phagocytophilum str. Annie]KJZ98418.
MRIGECSYSKLKSMCNMQKDSRNNDTNSNTLTIKKPK